MHLAFEKGRRGLASSNPSSSSYAFDTRAFSSSQGSIFCARASCILSPGRALGARSINGLIPATVLPTKYNGFSIFNYVDRCGGGMWELALF